MSLAPAKTRKDNGLVETQIFRYNQIPAAVLGPKDLEKPKWDEDLYTKLEQLYQRAFEPDAVCAGASRWVSVGADVNNGPRF